MAKRKSGRDVHGIVLLDKRLGASSNQALQEVRRLFNANKAGHTGALDPLATGLLPLCFGEATKVSALMLDDDKRYQVTIQLGVMTDTGDSEGKIVAEMPVPALDGVQLQACLQHFTGPIEQVPPMYSALKHQGKKLYELAREGKTVDRQPRAITIYELQLLNFDAELGQLRLDVFCSKGTYIRSLAEDIGHWLGTCGTVTALRRTKAGMFDLEQAYTLQQLQAMGFAELQNTLIELDVPLKAIPEVSLSTEQAEKIKLGQRIAFNGGMAGQVRIYSPQAFLGLGEILLDGKLAPKKLFHLEDQTT
ncbi:tRNA pseudouridine(55) synthase TruB [Methylomonas sp. ZR1]|uniref:tRNA pseudouridine(55) synthase TruB n=1 Tax=Methylomonas sp. ZR1 TaxID=1797072 RepID=UPI001490E857|nr:tRNA pseudouridine(55) synthase TruB [Methylomonas sp. ZR1]NOV28678.1 tRNA pseudouridine(55) synthase TruB [Methylomonas sp. ZR1]